MLARMRWLWVIAVGCGLVCAVAAEAAISFQGLGDLPGGMDLSQATGVSSDGSVVVGFSSINVWQPTPGELPTVYCTAFRWTRQAGLAGMDNFPGGWPPPLQFLGTGAYGGYAYAASADGSVIVGESLQHPFMWTAAGGMVDMGRLSPTDTQGKAVAVSANGSVVVGTSGSKLFRWTAATGMIDLGDWGGSESQAISADGRVVAFDRGGKLYRWTEQRGTDLLADLGGDGFSVTGASADGAVIVGNGRDSHGMSAAYRWTQETGLTWLSFPFPDNVHYSHAYAVSPDGQMVVGSYSGGGAFIWDEADGARNLATVLGDLGADVGGWWLKEARGISADGLTIVGNGTSPSNHAEAWVVTIPEPGLLGTGMGVSILLGLRRLGRRTSVGRRI